MNREPLGGEGPATDVGITLLQTVRSTEYPSGGTVGAKGKGVVRMGSSGGIDSGLYAEVDRIAYSESILS